MIPVQNPPKMKRDQVLAEWLASCDRSDQALRNERISADDYLQTVREQIAALNACRADGWTIEALAAIRRNERMLPHD